MINIIVDFRGRVQFDMGTGNLPAFLKDTGMTLEEFLNDRDMVLDYILGNWDNLDIDIPVDELEIFDYEVGEV